MGGQITNVESTFSVATCSLDGSPKVTRRGQGYIQYGSSTVKSSIVMMIMIMIMMIMVSALG